MAGVQGQGGRVLGGRGLGPPGGGGVQAADQGPHHRDHQGHHRAQGVHVDQL